MRIEIEIPKEFEGDYDADRFSDFFSRAVIDIETMQGMCGRYEVETAEMLRKAFVESKLAYDVEAVVAELEVEKERHEKDRTYWSEHSWKDSLMYNECDMSDRKADCFDAAISIVRGKE